MQIHEIHIDGFGIFTDKHATGLTSGVNVIYGPNEFGKTTLLDFIRRILFGFPRISTSTNPYPAVHGGAYGGRLVCELCSGANITILRMEGPHRGKVIISKESGELSGQDSLDSILGYITETFYNNVYAISLDELQEVKSLQGEDIRNRIYGAGLGLGGISLTAIKGEFIKQREALYKPSRSKQEMSRLYGDIRELKGKIREIQKDLEKYDDTLKQRDVLIEEVKDIGGKINNLELEKRSLEHKENLYPTYLDLCDAKSELSELEVLPLFTEEALEKLEERKKDLLGLEKQVTEDSDNIRDWESKRKGLVYNEQVIEQEASVLSLQRSSDSYTSALRDIPSVKQERGDSARKIQGEFARMGEGWTEEAVMNFNLTHLQKDTMRSYKTGLDDAMRNVRSAEDKLEQHRETKLAAAPGGFKGPAFYKYAMYCMVGLGLAGGVWGAISSQWGLAGLSATILIIGALVSLNIWRGNKIKLVDHLENRFDERLGQAKSEYKRLDDEWREFLRGINFDESLSPDGALEVARAIEDIQSALSSRDKLDDRIRRMQATIDDAKRLHDKVTSCFDKLEISDDICANIEIFVKHLDTAKNTKRDKENLGRQIEELTTKIDGLRAEREKAEKEFQRYIYSLGAADEEDFRAKYEVFTRRIKLSDKINESRKIIQTAIGIGSYYDNFIKSISATNPEEIEFQLGQANDEIKGLKADLERKNQAIGGLRTKIEQLSSGEDLLVSQSQIELKKQQLYDYSREWVKLQISLFALEKAISKYEDTRQPGVIKAAEGVFFTITDGTYTAIIKPVDSDELHIRDSLGISKSVVKMSRGTKEQLYLAMRLGLIGEYEIRSEPMPIITDDILVNFDDDRGPLAIKALEEFSRDRQIIVLTCHKDALDVYKQLGAKEIILS